MYVLFSNALPQGWAALLDPTAPRWLRSFGAGEWHYYTAAIALSPERGGLLHILGLGARNGTPLAPCVWLVAALDRLRHTVPMRV